MKVPAIAVLAAFLGAALAVPAAAAVPYGPDTVRKTRLSETDVLITWDDNSFDEQGFYVYRRALVDGGGGFELRGTVGPDVTQFIDQAAKDTLFAYVVQAFNADGVSDLSNICYVTRTPPPKPLSFYVKLIALYTVDVSWSDQSNGERGFEIQKAEIGRAFRTIARTPPNTEYYRDETDKPATGYVYRMRAIGRSGVCQDDSAYTPLRVLTTLGAKRILAVDLRGLGNGTVVSIPPGISCGPKDDHCTAEFPLATDVTLVAKAKPKSRFAGWRDIKRCEYKTGNCTINMGDNKQIGAMFRKLPAEIVP